MAKSKIRWKDSDSAELQRLVKNFNAKLTRLEKKNPATAQSLPKRASVKELKQGIETRADLQRELRSLQGFTKKGAEKIVKSSRGAQAMKWEIDEFNKAQRRLNRERAKERARQDEIEMKSRGKNLNLKRKEMGSVHRNALRESKKKFDNLSAKEWELAKKSIDNQLDNNYKSAKASKMKQNYIRGLKENGFSDDLIELVESKSDDEFLETFESDTEASFDFIYDELELQTKENALMDVWRNKK